MIAWDQAMYEASYSVRVKDPSDPQFGQMVSYGRKMALNTMRDPDTGLWGQSLGFWKNRIRTIAAKVQLSFGSSLLVVGCGFGYLMETALAEGMSLSKVWGADTSSWIQANKGVESIPAVSSNILDIDITDADAANQFKNSGVGGNGKFNWIVTEQVVESLDPVTELSGFLTACDDLQSGPGGVVHLFTPLHPGSDLTLGLNWQPKEYWPPFSPSHFWITSGSFDLWDPGQGAWV